MQYQSHSKIKSLIILVIIGTFVFTALIACQPTESSDNNTQGTGSSSASASTANITTDQMANYHNALAKNAPIDFGGATFTFLVVQVTDNGWTQWNEKDIVSDAGQETGDPINDAVYKRNSQIEQDFNVKIVMNEDASSGGTQFHTDLKKMVQAGSQDYQVAMGHLADSHTDWSSGLYLDLNGISSMNLSAPYYIQNSISGLSIAHFLPVVQSDLQLKPYESQQAMIFNKKLVQDYNMPDMYNLVKAGQWTLDELQTLASSAYKDLNGDGAMTFEQDQFGLITQADTLPSFLHGAGCMYVTKNSDTDIPVPSFDTQKTYDVLNKTCEMMFNNTYSVDLHVYNIRYPDIYNEQVKVFEAGQAVFSWVRLILVEQLRGMDTDFGILPIPKYDANQANYICETSPYTSNAIGIPKSVQNPEEVGALIDAMSALSRDLLQPAYYDINLQGKLIRDDQSKDMLDIIFSNPCYDPGEIYDFGGLNSLVINAGIYGKAPTDWASSYAKLASKMQNDIDTVVTSFAGLA